MGWRGRGRGGCRRDGREEPCSGAPGNPSRCQTQSRTQSAHPPPLPPFPPPPTQLLRVLDLVNAGLAGPGALAERASDFSRIKRVTTLLEAGLLDVGASLALFLGD